MISRHKVPSGYTFGWNISVTNLTSLGGFAGYSSVKTILKVNMPPGSIESFDRVVIVPSQGVSSGPMMEAVQTNKLSSFTGLALTPYNIRHST